MKQFGIVDAVCIQELLDSGSDNMSVTFTSHRKEVEEQFRQCKLLAMQAIGETAEGYAKQECPVDTGRLRNSISYKISGADVYIGTNVEYAPHVEFTDMEHEVGNAHFLKNAAANHSEEYKSLAKWALS